MIKQRNLYQEPHCSPLSDRLPPHPLGSTTKAECVCLPSAPHEQNEPTRAPRKKKSVLIYWSLVCHRRRHRYLDSALQVDTKLAGESLLSTRLVVKLSPLPGLHTGLMVGLVYQVTTALFLHFPLFSSLRLLLFLAF